MRRTMFTAIISGMALAGCATAPAIPPEAASTPFVIEQDLIGRTIARGEFRAINGVQRGFSAELNGAWDSETFTLVEDFVYDDGERDRKTWRLTRTSDGEYVGTREDVVGQARGYQDGDVFRLDYKVRLPSENGEGRVVRFRDVMAETADGRVINHANVGVWGIRVARVELTISRAP